MSNHTIYLDYAAATPVHPDVVAAMIPHFTEKFYNPSALYLAAKDVQADVKSVRSQIAATLGAKPSEIIFTAGGTEANNLAIRGVMQANPGAHVIVSAVEHESVLEPAHQFNCSEAPVDDKGVVDVQKLQKLIHGDTVLVSVMLANNEVGSIQPIHAIGAAIEQVRRDRRASGNKKPLYLHTDAAQATNYLDLHVSKLGVDLMTINGGKIYGPKQSGLLYVKTGVKLSPQIVGGGQERGYRSGTENVPAIIGFAKALELANSNRKSEAERLRKLQVQFISKLQAKLPDVIINGSRKHRLPNNVHITLTGKDNERLMMELDERGIQCATGSACSASNDEPSHVLKAMGISEADARSSLRFTMGAHTTQADITKTVSTLVEICL